MVRLGGAKGRAVLPLLGRSPRIPDPGQHVDIRLEDGSWKRGFRAISDPSTAETGGGVIWVCTQDEYAEARRDARPAVGLPWPVERMRVSSRRPWHLYYPQK